MRVIHHGMIVLLAKKLAKTIHKQQQLLAISGLLRFKVALMI